MERRCDKCGRILKPGDLVYRLEIQCLSDFDGIITEPEEDLATLLKTVEETPKELLEEEIHREFHFLLCPTCKDHFCANPLNLPLDSMEIPKSIPDPAEPDPPPQLQTHGEDEK
ncbi:hypothetical protein IIA15_04315 [candidate division TA06 bacterium]|nr:hypothetical protein [candidate division TA06 bacterium]